jgi:hypothetical protein
MDGWAIQELIIGTLLPIAWITAAVAAVKVWKSRGRGPATWLAVFVFLMMLSNALRAIVPRCWTPWNGNPPAWFITCSETSIWLSHVAVIPLIVALILMVKSDRNA